MDGLLYVTAHLRACISFSFFAVSGDDIIDRLGRKIDYFSIRQKVRQPHIHQWPLPGNKIDIFCISRNQSWGKPLQNFVFFFLSSIDSTMLHDKESYSLSDSERPKSLRRLFNRVSKSQKFQLITAFNTRSTTLNAAGEPPSSKANEAVKEEAAHDICLITDSPHYVVRVKEMSIHVFYRCISDSR